MIDLNVWNVQGHIIAQEGLIRVCKGTLELKMG